MVSICCCSYMNAVMKELSIAENDLPPVRVEPRTPWLKVQCSTTEPKS